MQDAGFSAYESYISDASGAGLAATSSYGTGAGMAFSYVREEGIVAEWSERGYGFVHFSDGRRAYVHNSQCGSEHLVVGETVRCIVVPDEKNPGKLQAQQVERLNAELAMQMRAVAAMSPGGLAIASEAAQTEYSTAAAVAAVANEAVAAEWASHDAAVAAASAASDPTAPAASTGMASLTSSTEALLAAIRAAAPGGDTSFTQSVNDVSTGPLTTLATSPSLDLASLTSLLDSTTDGTSPNNFGPRLEGTVTRWTDRGFGFIEFTDGQRAYCHKSQAGGENLAVGQIVTAVLGIDSKNPDKIAAHAVQKGPLGEDGVVTEWREEGGYGFMLLDDGRRAYVHGSVLGGGSNLVVGQRLRVRTRPDSRNAGKWCVAEVKAELATGAAVPGQSTALTDKSIVELLGALAGAPGAKPETSLALMKTDTLAISAAAASAAAGQEADGTVSKWKEEGGYGFLSMDDGRRIYIHRNFFGGVGSLQVGQRLRVTTKPDPRNPGKWCVDQVVGELQETAPVSAPPSSSAGVEGLEGLQAAGLSLEAASSLAAAVAAGGTAAGNSWDELFGAGAYAAALSAAAQGVLAGGAASGSEASSGVVATAPPEVHEGIVAEWHETNGYGFLTMDDSRRVYVHRNSFGGAGSLVLGSRMQVSV
eukprot:TRINITY_DN7501_c1_g1_i1.p1 TRINITY_DN7501_c1_g1~~TRINITY_DN7501_c1_g1_i1.p1  ORF type:complete len:648 (-),score=111.37 TRINITY_DN7501_c1_g1_i1:120-2063(-)